ncbi:hypothetical protein JHK82_025222 [Glycine max]|nr:hypothetical protein JHK82_025222 [Glycine max]
MIGNLHFLLNTVHQRFSQDNTGRVIPELHEVIEVIGPLMFPFGPSRSWSVAIAQSATFVALSYAPKDFTVRRNPPELVAPANPTPRELKLLSGIDDQHGLRYQLPFVQFYRYQPAMTGKDPVQVIRKALAKTLVFYYRFAGRLREGPNGKLTVDCDEEGVLFIEADADVAIEQFGDNFMPPFPFFDELLYNVPGSDGIIECPLVLIQVISQKGGFGAMPEVSFYNPYTNSKGEQGRVVLICLPEYAMERLEKELDIMHTHVINVQYLKDGNN